MPADMRARVSAAVALVIALAACGTAVAAAAEASPAAARPADAIDEPLTAVPGDAARGRAIVVDRRRGLCLLCHAGPFPEERFQGNLATDLAGAGSRWSAGQLRLRIVDSRRLDPDALMPAMHRTEGLTQVGAAWRGRPILEAQQVEDVVAFLLTLRQP